MPTSTHAAALVRALAPALTVAPAFTRITPKTPIAASTRAA